MQQDLLSDINQMYSASLDLFNKVEKIQQQESQQKKSEQTDKSQKSIIHQNDQKQHEQVAQQPIKEQKEQLLQIKEKIINYLLSNSINEDQTTQKLNDLKIVNQIRIFKLHLIHKITQQILHQIQTQNLAKFITSPEQNINPISSKTAQHYNELSNQVNVILEQLNTKAKQNTDFKQLEQEYQHQVLKRLLYDDSNEQQSQFNQTNSNLLHQVLENLKFTKSQEKMDIKQASIGDFNESNGSSQNNVATTTFIIVNIIKNFLQQLIKQVFDQIQNNNQDIDINLIIIQLYEKQFEQNTIQEIDQFLENLVLQSSDSLGNQIIQNNLQQTQQKAKKLTFLYLNDKNIDLEQSQQLKQMKQPTKENIQIVIKQLKEEIYKNIQQLQNIDQFSDQIYMLMSADQNVTQSDVDLLQNVFSQFESEQYVNFQEQVKVQSPKINQTQSQYMSVTQSIAPGTGTTVNLPNTRMPMKQTYQKEIQVDKNSLFNQFLILQILQTEEFPHHSLHQSEFRTSQLNIDSRNNDIQVALQQVKQQYSKNQQVIQFVNNLKNNLNNINNLQYFIFYQQFISNFKHFSDRPEKQTQCDNLISDFDVISRYITDVEQNANKIKLGEEVELQQKIKQYLSSFMIEIDQLLQQARGCIQNLQQIERNAGVSPQIVQVLKDAEIQLGVEKVVNFAENLQKRSLQQINAEIQSFSKIQQQIQLQSEIQHEDHQKEELKQILKDIHSLLEKNLEGDDVTLLEVMSQEAGL